jgi:DNA polymerase-3 subunit alpha
LAKLNAFIFSSSQRKISMTDGILNFVLHSEYTLTDGAIRLPDLFNFAKEKGLKTIGLSDFLVLHGAHEFLKLAQKFQIKPLLGLEVMLKTDSGDSLGVIPVFARQERGYRQLLKLSSSLSFHKGSLPWSEFCEHQDDLLILLGHRKSFLWKNLKSKKSVLDELHLFKKISEEGRCFFQIPHNGFPDESDVLPQILDVAKSGWGLPLYAPSLLYLSERDRETYLSLLAIKHGLKREQVQQIGSLGDFSLLTEENLASRIGSYEFLLSNNERFLSQIQLEQPKQSIRMPKLPDQEEGFEEEELKKLTYQGLEKRQPQIQEWLGSDFDQRWPEYQARLDTELKIIYEMKFTGYFLIVHDYVEWCHKEGLPVGPGRGSAAGSLVTYCLGVTDLDPIRFHLLFERFLNPERISLPDIDIDFCQERRDEVLNYVAKRYGRSQVAQIVTFGRLKARNALKSIARIYGWGFQKSNEFSQKIPKFATLQEAFDESSELRSEIEASSQIREVWEEALKVEGTLNSLGIHAAGVLIGDSPLDELCPLMNLDGQTITQFEQKAAEDSGLIKFDFLGLKNLTIIKRTCDFIQKEGGKPPNLSQLPFDDQAVFDLLKKGAVWGLFQLESPGMKKLVVDLQPETFEDIIALLSLYRPGPLGSGMVDDFVARRHGRQKTDYLFPELEPILKDTYGLIVYQEQVQKIASALAGYSLGEADLLRRAMGKKIASEMDQQRDRFLAGMKAHQYDEAKSQLLFDLMAKFAEYGFNKSHSAAYGFVTYQTAYLKAHYPREFLCAQLSSDLESIERIEESLRECRRLGLTVFPPNINSSHYRFEPEGNGIRFGLGALKGLGEKFCVEMIKERENRGPFSSVPEFLARLDPHLLNKRVLEKLVLAGVFDEFSSNRREILVNFEQWCVAIQSESKTQGLNVFSKTGDVSSSSQTPLLPRQETVPFSVFRSLTLLSALDWSGLERAEREFQEFGFFVSQHPLDFFSSEWSFLNLTPLSDLSPSLSTQRVFVGGRLRQISIKPVRSKKFPFLIVLVLDDQYGQLTCFQFSKTDQISFKEGDLVLARLILKLNQNRKEFHVEHLIRFDVWLKNRLESVSISFSANQLNEFPLSQVKKFLGELPAGRSRVKLKVFFPEEKLWAKADLAFQSVTFPLEALLQLKTFLTTDMKLENHYL